MTLQERLVELVAARGADIVDDPAEFRAALDDYLTDEEITPGDRNVLTDAVRLGAVRRLLALLDHGSDPRSAVAEAGNALAAERGSDDPRRSMRATALMGFAVGRLDAGVLQSFPEVVSTGAPPPPPPLSPVAPTRVPAAPTAPPAAPAQQDPDLSPPDFGPTRVVPTGGEPAGRSSGGRRWLLIAAAAVVLLLVAGAATWWLALRGESPEEGVERWFDAGSCEDLADRSTGPALEEIQAQIDLGEDGGCPTFEEYSWEYEVTSSEENGDSATIEVEGTQFHDGPNEDEPDEQDFSAEIDLRHVDDEWLVSRADMSYDDE